MSSPQGPITVLHFLYTSLPTVAGYTIRSACILRAQKEHGLAPVAATMPEYAGGTATDTIDGVVYHRWTAEALGGAWSWVRRVPGLRNRWRAARETEFYAEIARRTGAQVLQAHSPGRCALLAGRVAARTGLPLVYEVRGLWDESAIAEGRLVPGSLEHERRLNEERKALAAADRIVAISEPLRDYLIQMGAEASRCIVVPNGVDTAEFRPWSGDNPLRADPRLTPGPVIGYVGSLRKMEGLDLAVRAMPQLAESLPTLRLAIVGDGPEREPLARLASELGVADRVVLAGPVPHDQVLAWYDLLDLFIVPRVDQPVTHLVPPLKPLEAMAAGRAVLLSDVGGMRELVADDHRGYRFRTGDVDDFAAKVRAAIADPEGRRRRGEEARRWVEGERTWKAVASAYVPLYRNLVSDPPRSTKTRLRRLVPTRAPARWFALWSLVVGASVLALSRVPGTRLDPVVQMILISHGVMYLASQWASRNALDGAVFRAASDTCFDVGFCVSLLGLGAWISRVPLFTGATITHRLVLTLGTVGMYCLFSASQVGFYLQGAGQNVAFWSVTRAVLAFGSALLARVRIDTWPLVFVFAVSGIAWVGHAICAWGRPRPLPPPPEPSGPPAARLAKPRDNIVDKFVFRPVSKWISLGLAPTGIDPNLVTYVALLVGGLSLYFYSHFGLQWRILGGASLLVAFLLDCVDGEVARLQGTTSAFGAWFDWMADRVVIFFAILGLATGAHYEHWTALLWVSTLCLISCEVFARTFRDRSSFVGVLGRGRTLSAAPGMMAAFHRWRERHGVGLSFGTGATVIVVALGTLVLQRFPTLLLLMLVRGVALSYKLAVMVWELE